MAAFSRKNFATVVKFFNMIYTFKFSEELRTKPNIFKNFITIAKLLFLLNANDSDRNKGNQHSKMHIGMSMHIGM